MPRPKKKPEPRIEDIARTLFPKAALKHDITNALGNLVGGLFSEGWQAVRKRLKNRK